jgi:hypothetical protein
MFLLALVLAYGLPLLSGFLVDTRLPLRSLTERVLLVVTVAAAQLLFAIQGLSLLTWLTSPKLLLAEGLLTLLVAGLLQLRAPVKDRPSWLELLAGAWHQFGIHRHNLAVWLPIALGLAGIGLFGALAWVMVPLGDIYHYDMPLFWQQNLSIAAFPVHNLRITSVSFGGEALTLPGFIYARSCVGVWAVAVLASALSLWVVFSLARRLGCSPAASAWAAALLHALPHFNAILFPLTCGNLLAGVWSGASLLLLLDSRRVPTALGMARLGFSVFCFVMACGCKNSITLLAPAYLVGLGLVFWEARTGQRHPETSQPQERPQLAGASASLPIPRALPLMTLCGVVGLLCSGVLWNYVNNKLWFGSCSGPAFIQEHVSHDFHPRAVWTRLARGVSLTFVDTFYVPGKAKAAYASVQGAVVHVLGGQGQLAEDDDEYYNFLPENRNPLKGTGPVGLLLLVPGAFLALRRCLKPAGAEQTRLAAALVLLFTVSAFVMIHIVFRWQKVGLLRLMPAFSIVAAPLFALLLDKGRFRLAAFGLLSLSMLLLLVNDLSLVGRRVDSGATNPLFVLVQRLCKNHDLQAQYQWQNQPPQPMLIREDYTSREVCRKFLEGIPQPCTMGLIGNYNTESFYLFGREFQNRVVPLVDARNLNQLLEPPCDGRYIVDLEGRSRGAEYALKHGYRPAFEIRAGDKTLFSAFEAPGAH